MKITELKVNGIEKPIGFEYPWVKISWKVEDFLDKKQALASIEISTDVDFSEILVKKEGKELTSIGEKVEIDLKPYTRYFYRVNVTGNQGETGTGSSYFETGKMEENWIADFIGTQQEDKFHPVFVKKFSLENAEAIKWARIYVTGLGLYEAYLNGQKIGNEYLAPFCNDYNKEIQYQTYDIADLLQKENTIEIITGNGWYKGRLGYDGDIAFFGDRFAAIAELRILEGSGSEIVVKTDGTWSYYGSKIAMSDIYDGEEYNHLLWEGRENPKKSVVIMNADEKTKYDKQKLVARYSLPVIVKGENKVKEVIHTPAGETVLDLGQNFTGYMQFVSRFPKGTTITLEYGEVLQQGNFYNDNYRSAKAKFIYVSDGNEEVVRPHFTYYGFRYVRVTGWIGELNSEDFIGKVVYSDLTTTSHFVSSNKMLNQLVSNCTWGQRSNFLDMPTDCPQRDERLSWTGDAQVFAPTASLNMDTRAFYRKFLHDLRLDQMDHSGIIPNYIPNNSHMPGGSSVWGDAATFIPTTLYEFYGDKDELNVCYPMMKDWVDFIIRSDKEHGENHLWNFGFHFGDWLAQDGITSQSMKGGTDDYFVASIYYYASTQKVAHAAKILGKKEDASYYTKKASQIYNAIRSEYFSKSGRLCIDTQTAYLICLRFGVYIEKQRVIDGLRERLRKDLYKIKGGFVGATMMCQVLAENGMENIAYYILFQEGFPGWMHCINLGATTIWERWNSILDDGSISGTGMNSLNHYAYGSVVEYVYRYIAGIRETAPGFTSVRFAPQLNAKLSSVNYTYDSISGKYVSNWKINENGTVTVHFEVPFNCAATVVLPGIEDKDKAEITLESGVFEKTYQPDVDFRNLYSMDTRLEELMHDERALDILKTDLPNAYALIESGDMEFINMSFGEIQHLFFRGFNPQMVQEGTKRLFSLKAELR